MKKPFLAVGSILFAGVLLLGENARAADFSMDPPTQSMVGNVRTIVAHGKYELAKGESLAGAYLEYLTPGTNVPAVMQGTFDRTTMSWQVKGGDFQLQKFRIRLDFKSGKNTRKITTPYYQWSRS